MLDTLLKPFTRTKPRQKNFLLALWNELNANAERYYVIDQRQFISEAFETQALDDARVFSGVKLPQQVGAYAAVLEEFNSLFNDCREFEEMYSSSIENKTLENAQILHAKKEALQEKLEVIQPKISEAQKALSDSLKSHK